MKNKQQPLTFGDVVMLTGKGYHPDYDMGAEFVLREKDPETGRWLIHGRYFGEDELELLYNEDDQAADWYAFNVYPLAQRLCKSDDGKQESNFGQMLELINDLADEINRNPVGTLRVILELAERLR